MNFGPVPASAQPEKGEYHEQQNDIEQRSRRLEGEDASQGGLFL
jgi:hypothetical protein